MNRENYNFANLVEKKSGELAISLEGKPARLKQRVDRQIEINKNIKKSKNKISREIIKLCKEDAEAAAGYLYEKGVDPVSVEDGVGFWILSVCRTGGQDTIEYWKEQPIPNKSPYKKSGLALTQTGDIVAFKDEDTQSAHYIVTPCLEDKVSDSLLARAERVDLKIDNIDEQPQLKSWRDFLSSCVALALESDSAIPPEHVWST